MGLFCVFDDIGVLNCSMLLDEVLDMRRNGCVSDLQMIAVVINIVF